MTKTMRTGGLVLAAGFVLGVLFTSYAVAGRVVSAERLAVGWLEKRTVEEIDFYPKIVALNRRIAAEALSGKVITPGVTTLDDLTWWTRERIAGLGLETWFQPTFYIVGSSSTGEGDRRVVERGDVVCCDIGVTYLGLKSDIQEAD